MRMSKARIAVMVIIAGGIAIVACDRHVYYRDCFNKFDVEKVEEALVARYEKRMDSRSHDLSFEVTPSRSGYGEPVGFSYRNADGSLHGVGTGDGCGVLGVNPDRDDAAYRP